MTSLLIDAASLAYRAYHAMPSLLAPDGETETGAMYGFLNFLARLLSDRRPDRAVVAFDADWRPSFRVEALPSYKAHRVAQKGEVDPVEQQIPILRTILDALGVSSAEAEGFEAEDVIATLAHRTTDRVEVVTGDRDLFALVGDPRVTVLYTLRGVSELATVDRGWVAQKYGIPGDRYLDYAILRGDPSDGLPGVRGIGEKGAAELLRRYGSLDAILAARDVVPTTRARLNAAAEYLSAARRVVAMVADCPVRGGDGALPASPADPRRLEALAGRYGLGTPIARVTAALAQLAG